jgi:hypothetical protein
MPRIAPTALASPIRSTVPSPTITATAITAATFASAFTRRAFTRSTLTTRLLRRLLLSPLRHRLYSLDRKSNRSLVRIARLRGLTVRLARQTPPPPASTASAPPAASIRSRCTLANLFLCALARRTIQIVIVNRRKARSKRSRAARLFLHRAFRPSLGLRLASTPFAIASIAPATPAAFTSTLAASFSLWPVSPRRPRLSTGSGRSIKLSRISRFFHEVGDVQERIAFQPDVHKARLHARQNARHTPVVNRAREGVLVLALVINLCEFVFFDDRQPRLMRRT